METTSHLAALELRLSHERDRLAASKTPKERELRRVWVAGIEKEIAAEKAFLGIPDTAAQCVMSDDELLEELLT